MITPVVYNSNDKSTDFRELVKDSKHCLLFAENLETYLRTLAAVNNPDSSYPGPTGGTACIRGKPNAFAIVTGHDGHGFQRLNQVITVDGKNYKVEHIIDSCFSGLLLNLASNSKRFTKLIYAADQLENRLRWGCSIFKPSVEILSYITNKIEGLKNNSEFQSYFVIELADLSKNPGYEALYRGFRDEGP
tara:strand:- start:2750 stop:3319 length:570 start_codon:yes stop_codon:yes gene_type:complete